MKADTSYDFIIIGAGAAGCSAAIYGARAGLKTLVVDTNAGGQILQIDKIENYPAIYPDVTGASFSNLLKTQAESFGANFISAKVYGIDKIKNQFIVKIENENSVDENSVQQALKPNTYTGTAVLVATGAEHNHLNIPGEKELAGKGVSYCAVCDGAFFAGKNIVVIGGGNSAVSEALFLTQIASHVTILLRRDKFRAAASLVNRLYSKSNATIRYETAVKKINGKNKVESIEISHAGKTELMECDAVFILAGMTPSTDLVAMLPHDEQGAVITNERMETIMPGLFVAGDVRSKPFRQIITAASDGAVAALAAAEYIDAQAGVTT